MLESRGRPLAPGDVLVLVRRRNAFARALVRALKTRGVPVAGLDRLVLTEQPAVQDLMALADALLLPQDDLNFACLLTSPLGGLNDDDLMALAVNRAGALFEALRARAHEQPALAARLGLLRRAAGAGRLRLALRAVRRGAGAARRPGAAVRPAGAGGGGAGGRTAERRAGLRAACTRRRCKASCTGCAAPVPR